MEVSAGISPRKQKHDDPDLRKSEIKSSDHGVVSDHQFPSTSALEILRETVRVLRFNLIGFMGIAALLICPVSAVLLSNMLVDQSVVKRLTIRLLLVAKASGFPLKPFIKQSCQKFSEMAISSAMCFPLYITLSLLSKAAVVYSVDCTYSRKTFCASKFYLIVTKIWRRLVLTYLWTCMVITGCLTLFLVLLVAAQGYKYTDSWDWLGPMVDDAIFNCSLLEPIAFILGFNGLAPLGLLHVYACVIVCLYISILQLCNNPKGIYCEEGWQQNFPWRSQFKDIS